MPKKISQEEAIFRFKKVHGNRFDYSKSLYTLKNKKLIVICHQHQVEFSIEAANHWNGQIGCKECVKEDIRIYNLNTYGVEHVFQSEEIRNKAKNTSFERYGVEHALQSPEFQERKTHTMIERYGVEHALQSDLIKERWIKTNNEKYGTDFGLQNKEVKDKSLQTLLEKYDVSHVSQILEVKEKIKLTNNVKYGVDHALSSPEIRDRIRKTNIEKYGFEYPMQNFEVQRKSIINSAKSKEYILPLSKSIIFLQGNEPQVLSYVLENKIYEESDFDFENIPVIKYNMRKYFPDFYIPKDNYIIEVKSWWTYKTDLKTNLLKKHACLLAGYKFNFYIWDNNQLTIL